MLVTAEAFLNDSLSRTSSPHRPSISSHRRARGGSSEPHSAPGCARAAPGAGPLRRRRRAAPWQGRNEFGAQRLSEFARHLAHEAAKAPLPASLDSDWCTGGTTVAWLTPFGSRPSFCARFTDPYKANQGLRRTARHAEGRSISAKDLATFMPRPTELLPLRRSRS